MKWVTPSAASVSIAWVKRTGSRICLVQYSGQLISSGPATLPETLETKVKRGALNATVLRIFANAGSAGVDQARMRRVAHPQPLRLRRRPSRRLAIANSTADTGPAMTTFSGPFHAAISSTPSLRAISAATTSWRASTAAIAPPAGELLGQTATFGDQPDRILKRQDARRVRGGIFTETMTKRGDRLDAP